MAQSKIAIQETPSGNNIQLRRRDPYLHVTGQSIERERTIPQGSQTPLTFTTERRACSSSVIPSCAYEIITVMELLIPVMLFGDSF